MDEPNRLIEGYVGAEQVLISIVMSNAGIFFNLVRI